MSFSKKHLALIVILLMTAVTSVWADTETIKVEYYHRDINHMTGQPEGYWITIDGRLMNKKPTAKGVYIHQGKKKVIK